MDINDNDEIIYTPRQIATELKIDPHLVGVYYTEFKDYLDEYTSLTKPINGHRRYSSKGLEVFFEIRRLLDEGKKYEDIRNIFRERDLAAAGSVGDLIDYRNLQKMEKIGEDASLTYKAIIQGKQETLQYLTPLPDLLRRVGGGLDKSLEQGQIVAQEVGKLSEIVQSSNENMEALGNQYEVLVKNMDIQREEMHPFLEFIRNLNNTVHQLSQDNQLITQELNAQKIKNNQLEEKLEKVLEFSQKAADLPDKLNDFSERIEAQITNINQENLEKIDAKMTTNILENLERMQAKMTLNTLEIQGKPSLFDRIFRRGVVLKREEMRKACQSIIDMDRGRSRNKTTTENETKASS